MQRIIGSDFGSDSPLLRIAEGQSWFEAGLNWLTFQKDPVTCKGFTGILLMLLTESESPWFQACLKSCSVKGRVMEYWAETRNAQWKGVVREASPTRCCVLVQNRNMAANSTNWNFVSQARWTVENEDKLLELSQHHECLFNVSSTTERTRKRVGQQLPWLWMQHGNC